MKKLFRFPSVCILVLVLLLTTALVGCRGIRAATDEQPPPPSPEAQEYDKLRELWQREAGDPNDEPVDKGFIGGLLPGGDNQQQEPDSNYQKQAELNSYKAGAYGDPVAIDLSDELYFPVIGNQGSFGSCGSWSTTYYTFTYEVARLNDWDVRTGDASTGTRITEKTFSPKFTYNFLNNGDSSAGTFFSGNFDILRRAGSATWEDFPYSGSTGDVKNYREWVTDGNIYKKALNTRLSSYTNLTTQVLTNVGDYITNAKQLLNEGHPVMFGTQNMDGWTRQHIEDYGWVVPYVKNSEGGHAMTIVGYDDNLWIDLNGDGDEQPAEFGAFKVANSWGNYTQHNNGFLWLCYDALYPTTQVPGYSPAGKVRALDESYYMQVQNYSAEFTAEVTLNTARRNNAGISIGSYVDASFTTTQTLFNSLAFDSATQLYAFDGTAAACDATFVLDFNEPVSAKNWRVRVADKHNDGYSVTVKSVKYYSSGVLLKDFTPNQTLSNTSADYDYTYTAPLTYTVTYNYSANGGTSATTTSAQYISGTSVSLTPTAVKATWDFVGWNTDANTTEGLASYIMPSSNVTLYAIFSISLTATFIDYNGLTKQTTTDSLTIYNQTPGWTAEPPTTPGVYTDWTWRGWSTATTPQGSLVTNFTITTSTTFYGTYQRTLSLSFDEGTDDDVTDMPPAQTGTQYTNSYNITNLSQVTLTLPSTAPQREEYTFVAWQSGGDTFTSGNPVSIASNTILTAIWTENSETESDWFKLALIIVGCNVIVAALVALNFFTMLKKKK